MKSQNKIAVDVVLFPPDELVDKAIEVNQALLKTFEFDNKIVLNKQNCFPHISLAMGCIKEDDIPKIDTVLKDIAENFSPITLTISDIRAGTIPTGEKVSWFEIEKTKELQLLHETVMNKLSPYFTYNVSLDMIYTLPNQQVEQVTTYWIRNYPKESSFEKFSPHITIGFGEVEGEKCGIQFPLRSSVSKLALCRLGNYCTCRKIVLLYDLKMKNKLPLVSVGMPVYNGEKYIRQALDSLLGQTYKNFELIISDNASTDETKKICEEYAKKDKRIKYIRQKENMGATNNFKFVLEQATGKYFMWASHDDRWDANFISHLVMSILETHPHIVLAACEAQYVLESEKKLPFFFEGTYYHDNFSQQKLSSRLKAIVKNNYGNLIYGVYRRHALFDRDGISVLTKLKANTMNEIPIFLNVAVAGSITVSKEVMFYKTTNLNTYIGAAYECGIYYKKNNILRDLNLDESEIDCININLKNSVQSNFAIKFIRRFVKVIYGITYDIYYHNQAFFDIVCVLWGLNIKTYLKIYSSFLFVFSIYTHLFSLIFNKLINKLIRLDV